MKPSIIKSGISTVAIAAMTVTLSGLASVGAQAAPATPEMANKLAGKTVFLDPGHQGPDHQENLARQVSDGRGGTKDCQTTGMTTMNGVPEHTINWNVTQLVKSSLESLGAHVVLSRQDDEGWGGCVDDRARAANQSGAAVAVSVHADSAPAEDHGFHLIVPALPIADGVVHQVQSGPGLAATKSVRDAYVKAGFAAANYAGVVDGLQTRNDIAGPALTTVPEVFIEMGNGANAEDAARLESQNGQVEHAIAITTGLVGYLLGAPQPVLPGLMSGSAAAHPAAAPALKLPSAAEVAPARAANVSEAQPVPRPRTVPRAQNVPQSGTVPQSRTVPGAQQPTPSLPGSRLGSPGTQLLPGVDGSGPIGQIMRLLMPLATALGLDNAVVTSELINIAYALASTLLSPTK